MGRKTYASVPATGPDAGGRLRVVLTRAPQSCAPAAGVEFTDASLEKVVQSLRARAFRRCALLGGGQVYAQFLDAGLVDALWLTLEPVVLGGGTPLADGVVRDGNFKLVETRPLSDNTLLLHYVRPGRRVLPLPELPR